MSWDTFVQHIPPSVRSLEDMPRDCKPESLGKRSHLILAIQEIIPNVDFRNPAWGIIDGPGYSLEVSMGDDEDVTGFAFHIRGGDDAAFLVADVLDHLGLPAFDPSAEADIFGVAEDPDRVCAGGGSIGIMCSASSPLETLGREFPKTTLAETSPSGPNLPITRHCGQEGSVTKAFDE